MNPQRTHRNSLAGNEIKERVTACRKRLRVNRLPQQTAASESREVSGVQNARFLDDQAAMRESFSSTELSSAALEGGNGKFEMLLTTATQEAGIP